MYLKNYTQNCHNTIQMFAQSFDHVSFFEFVGNLIQTTSSTTEDNKKDFSYKLQKDHIVVKNVYKFCIVTVLVILFLDLFYFKVIYE